MGLEFKLPEVITTKLDWVLNWGRKHSLWPQPFGTACCSIELMATQCSDYDMSRFGAEVMKFPVRQSDVMIIGGRVSVKMMPVLIKIYEQMAEPKYVISFGACCSTGGMFDTYTLVQGVNQFIPVDVYMPGCPPRPETLLDALMFLQKKIEKEKIQDKLHGS